MTTAMIRALLPADFATRTGAVGHQLGLGSARAVPGLSRIGLSPGSWPLQSSIDRPLTGRSWRKAPFRVIGRLSMRRVEEVAAHEGVHREFGRHEWVHIDSQALVNQPYDGIVVSRG